MDWPWRLLEFGVRMRISRYARNELRRTLWEEQEMKRNSKVQALADEAVRYRRALEEIIKATAPALEWYDGLSRDGKNSITGHGGFMVMDIAVAHKLAVEALHGSTTGTQRDDSAERAATD